MQSPLLQKQNSQSWFTIRSVLCGLCLLALTLVAVHSNRTSEFSLAGDPSQQKSPPKSPTSPKAPKASKSDTAASPSAAAAASSAAGGNKMMPFFFHDEIQKWDHTP